MGGSTCMHCIAVFPKFSPIIVRGLFIHNGLLYKENAVIVD